MSARAGEQSENTQFAYKGREEALKEQERRLGKCLVSEAETQGSLVIWKVGHFTKERVILCVRECAEVG